MKTLISLALTLACLTVHANDELDAVLEALPDEQQARYPYRNPKETLDFLEVTPGSTVVEALPGGGWYSKILIPYLGSKGKLIGMDYNLNIWSNFPFANEEFKAKRRKWPETWPQEAGAWHGDEGATIKAIQMGSTPNELTGTVDTILFIRAMHNLFRFNEKDGPNYLEEALSDSFRMLKPGGTLGVVQHQAREDRPDEWADGNAGYVKKSAVIDSIIAAGFEFVSESDINENPNDQAADGDIVWRLPPSYRGSNTDEEKAELDKIGESHRMTLKFRKPI